MKTSRRILLGIMVTVASVSHAAQASIGALSSSLQGPVSQLTSIALKVCLVLGVVLLVTSGIRYQQYRRNDNQVRMSDVLFCFLLGLSLVLLSLFVQYIYLPSIQA